jgi:hypothetical protein
VDRLKATAKFRQAPGPVAGRRLWLGLAWLALVAIGAAWHQPAWAAVRSAATSTTSITSAAAPATASTDGPTASPTAAPPLPTQPVDWPTVPPPESLPVLARTSNFRVYVSEPSDAALRATAERWTGTLETILTIDATHLGLTQPSSLVSVTFAPAYPAPCPARGLTSRGTEGPEVTIFVGPDTSDIQIRAVIAHELVHVLTMRDTFTGDGVLTEGIANWGAGSFMLQWQGYPSWEAAVIQELHDGTYVSIADPNGMAPAPGQDCLVRRDIVYNARAAFTGWLAQRIGLDTVLAMPRREVPRRGNGETHTDIVPDYEAATGLSLAQLETVWLADISGSM